MADRKQTVFVVPFSHLDLFWLGNRHECWSRGARVFREAIRLCRKHKSFRFLIEDAVFLDNFLHTVPECRTALRKLMKAGRIQAPAKWAAITVTNVNGETLVRNHMFGIRYTEAFCGLAPRAIHLGDLPGLPAQFPQVMAGCGLTSVVLSRGGPARTPLFTWKGLDGTRVRAWYAPECYNWGMHLAVDPATFHDRHAARLRASARAVAKTTPSHVFMHSGWDLSVPTDAMIENLEAWNRAAGGGLSMRFATQEEFFTAVRRARGVPVLSGELPTVWGNWPDAAYLDVTSHYAAAEATLLWAERLQACDLAEGTAARGPTLEPAWKMLLEAMDHNYSLIATEETHAEKNGLTESARLAAESVIRVAMARRAAGVAADADTVPVLVFNPSSYVRGECVTHRVLLYGHPFHSQVSAWRAYHLTDDRGAVVATQELARRECGTIELRIAFAARDVPALGYRTYYLRPGVPSEGKAAAPARPGRRASIRGGDLCVTVNRRTGALRITDAAGRPLLNALKLRGVEARRENQVMQLASTGRTLPFRCRDVRVEAGPVVSRIVMHGSVGATDARLDASVPADGGRVALSVRLEHNGRGFQRIQLYGALPGGRAGDGMIGGPFAANSTSNVLKGCGPTLPDEVHPDEWPRLREAQDWFLLKGRETRSALAVATPRKLLELLPEGFAVNLLSSMTAKWIRPDEVFHPFAGTYDMTFLAAPVQPGDVTAAARLGEAGFMPLRAFCDYSGPAPRTGRPVCEGLRVSHPAVRLTALKPAEDGNGLVARFVESSGRAVTTRIDWPYRVTGVRVCDLLERPGRPANFARVRFKPFEIRTFRFETVTSTQPSRRTRP